ncbi:hypothetical protein [Aequorivita xiaoshiensis]|uniref:hypothetical protein n=1 Tax=Aequorivita xiaoshiensis TaxID=2874476 RepID=UPI001F1924C2|nr:hypothetical protein [Aequorivita xiaoshiensis]
MFQRHSDPYPSVRISKLTVPVPSAAWSKVVDCELLELSSSLGIVTSSVFVLFNV